MNNTDPLANLRDIHLPPDVSWWPLAPGWWVLIGLFITLLVWIGYHIWQRHQNLALVREVQQELTEIESVFVQNNDRHALLANYAQLLRRLLIHTRCRADTAGKTGQEWLDLITAQVPELPLETKYLTLLGEGHYQKQINIDDLKPLIDWVNLCAISISKQAIRSSSHA